MTQPATLDPRTAEPRRPLLAWAVLVAFFAAAGTSLMTLLLSMWLSVGQFQEAARLHAWVPTGLGDPLRALLVTAVWASAVVIGTVAVIAGYYGWAGHGWARSAGLVAVGVAPLSVIGHPWALAVLAPLVVGAGLLWLPPMRRFASGWDRVRQPTTQPAPARDAVYYGPLPRYS